MKTHINTNTPTEAPKIDRIKIAIDMHKASYRVVRQCDYAAPEPPQKFTPEQFGPWLQKQLGLARAVYVCYEAGCFGYEPARRWQALGAHVLVIAPQNWDQQQKRQVNDKLDARVMCQRLSQHLDGHRHALSVVRIPTREEERRRDLARQREQLRRQQRSLQAMGRSFLFKHEVFVTGRWWAGAGWARLQKQQPAALLAHLEPYRALLLEYEKQAQAVEAQLTAETAQAELFYGEGALSHELLARELADPQRFRNARQVGNYFGLCPSESTTSESRHLGAITKHGHPRLRRLMVELAWRVAVRQPHYRGTRKWSRILHGSASSAARKKAIVALARQLAVDLWRVRTGRRTFADLGLVRTAAELPQPSRPVAASAAASPAGATAASPERATGAAPARPHRTTTRHCAPRGATAMN